MERGVPEVFWGVRFLIFLSQNEDECCTYSQIRETKANQSVDNNKKQIKITFNLLLLIPNTKVYDESQTHYCHPQRPSCHGYVVLFRKTKSAPCFGLGWEFDNSAQQEQELGLMTI